MKLSTKLIVGIVAILSFSPAMMGWKSSSQSTFRDLNKNGKKDIYEDATQPVETRIKDLLIQMTLEEKAGMMFIAGTRINDDGSLDDIPGQGMFARMPQANRLIIDHKITHMNIWAAPGTKALATWYNNVQKVAEDSRLGIPISIASDPRHYFSNNIFAMARTTWFCSA